MATEPPVKNAMAFFDGQNLFHAVKEAFGYTYPNYDPRCLAEAVCAKQGWTLNQVRFYTGVHDARANSFWSHFWQAKLLQLSRDGVWTYARPLRYRNTLVKLPDGTEQTALAGQEKGIDVRIALDVVRMILDGACNVALVFSQDQDLTEVADEVRLIARAWTAGSRSPRPFPPARRLATTAVLTRRTGSPSIGPRTTRVSTHVTTDSSPEPARNALRCWPGRRSLSRAQRASSGCNR